jgi:hypothetical protein
MTREFTKLRDEISSSSSARKPVTPKYVPRPEPEPEPEPMPAVGFAPALVEERAVQELDQMFLSPDGEQLELEPALPQHRAVSASFASASSPTPASTRARGSSVPPAVFSTPRGHGSPPVRTVSAHSSTKELAAKLMELGARDPHGLGALLAAQDS